jgi:hypothetical protein
MTMRRIVEPTVNEPSKADDDVGTVPYLSVLMPFIARQFDPLTPSKRAPAGHQIADAIEEVNKIGAQRKSI